MTLQEIRDVIDTIDPEMKRLFLKRMDAAKNVAEVKFASQDAIYKADRETEILARLTEDVAPELKAEYTAFVRKVMQAARKYEYGLLYEWNPKAAEGLWENCKESQDGAVKVRLTRRNQINSMAEVLSMVGDYGFHMKQMTLLKEDREEVEFELVIAGSIHEKEMKKLLYQLSEETKKFEVL